MKQIKHTKIYVIFFILQLLTLIGCGKSNYTPVFPQCKNSDFEVHKTSKNVISTVRKPTNPKSSLLSRNVTNRIIVIDPGHQERDNREEEPIAPGSDRKKAKASIGCKGIKTKLPEYMINLAVARKLQTILRQLGHTAILTRESNDVNISNRQRAEIANRNQADLFIQLHCNSSDNKKISGILAMCPTRVNKNCHKIYQASASLCETILQHLAKVTNAKNNGVLETDFMTSINYSKVPVCFLELGYLSNRKEDQKLSTNLYEQDLAVGIATGIQAYFRQKDSN